MRIREELARPVECNGRHAWRLAAGRRVYELADLDALDDIPQPDLAVRAGGGERSRPRRMKRER
eukprot:2725628-Prymnesium_polylepis.2